MAAEITSITTWEPDTRELDIFRKHFAPEKTTDSEWETYLETCRTYRLSPMRKQIYLVSRWDSIKSRMCATPQISIGGLRALALRTGQFEGTTEPEWGDEEGNWYKLWPKAKGPYPYAARIGVYRHGFRAPVWGVAYFHELAQKKKDGSLTKFWADMGIHMIQKCCLADALRGAFEEEVGGLYLHEEMNQADADGVVVNIVPEPAGDTNEALQQTAAATVEERSASRQTTSLANDQNTPPTIAELKTMLEQANLLNDTGAYMTWSDLIALSFEKDIQNGYTVEKIIALGNKGKFKLGTRQHLASIIDSLKRTQNGEIRKHSPSTEEQEQQAN